MTWVTWTDAVNGSLELAGGLFILLSIYKLSQEQQVRGVSWVHVIFFAAWGYWNLFYYPQLEQYLSFMGGIVIVTTNTIWVGQLIYYTRRERAMAAKAAMAERLRNHTTWPRDIL